MRENSKETVRMHMYGLSKIYEHRGFPDIDSDFEIRLLRGALSLIVSKTKSQFVAMKQMHQSTVALIHYTRCYRATLATPHATGLKENGATSFSAYGTRKPQ